MPLEENSDEDVKNQWRCISLEVRAVNHLSSSTEFYPSRRMMEDSGDAVFAVGLISRSSEERTFRLIAARSFIMKINERTSID